MPNIAAALNDHIRRLARRQINLSTRPTRRLTAQFRRDVAALKREVVSLHKTVTFLETQEKRRADQLPVSAEATKGRFRAAGLKSHRAKLNLAAADYGRLVGASGASIYLWEQGKSKPRKAQVARLVAVRKLGKREALKRLELLGKK
jgi:DNA-binding transcriptional regulator YiaG